jgi:hypothetical protein
MESSMKRIAEYQMALRVVGELLDGSGNAGELAERMTEKDEDGMSYSEEHVNDALGVLDEWSLLDFFGLEDNDPVALRGL